MKVNPVNFERLFIPCLIGMDTNYKVQAVLHTWNSLSDQSVSTVIRPGQVSESNNFTGPVEKSRALPALCWVPKQA